MLLLLCGWGVDAMFSRLVDAIFRISRRLVPYCGRPFSFL